MRISSHGFFPEKMGQVVCCLFILFVFTEARAGPISEYLANADTPDQGLYVQGNSVIRSWNISRTEFALAVENTVRIIQLNSLQGPPGRQYTLQGVPTGVTYFAPPFALFNSFFDGTTDGTHNYAIGLNMVTVVQFDSHWKNPVNLFELPHQGAYLGITYDRSNDSLWISPWSGHNTVQNWTMDGTLISEFTAESDLLAALALDPADDTLWMMDRRVDDPYGRYLQYSKSGQLLSVQHYEGLGNTLGGEFRFRHGRPVFEPATIALLGFGLAGLGYSRRRRT